MEDSKAIHGNVKCECGHNRRNHCGGEGKCEECGCKKFRANSSYAEGNRKRKESLRVRKIKESESSTTIMESLLNANENLKTGYSVSTAIGKEQLNNAVTLLGKGYDLEDTVETVIRAYGSASNAPFKLSNLKL